MDPSSSTWLANPVPGCRSYRTALLPVKPADNSHRAVYEDDTTTTTTTTTTTRQRRDVQCKQNNNDLHPSRYCLGEELRFGCLATFRNRTKTGRTRRQMAQLYTNPVFIWGGSLERSWRNGVGFMYGRRSYKLRLICQLSENREVNLVTTSTDSALFSLCHFWLHFRALANRRRHVTASWRPLLYTDHTPVNGLLCDRPYSGHERSERVTLTFTTEHSY